MNNPDKTTPTVGKLLTDNPGRDAIHFALAPVEAAEKLSPGQRVVVLEGSGGRRVRKCYSDETPTGIIDPFLDCLYVAEGDKCWLFLMPNTITNLRHIWSHPAFVTKVPGNG